MSLYLDIHKHFRGFKLDVRLDVGNDTLAILGASGSGKSLTLGCVSGIIKPDEGKIILNDKTIFDSKNNINLPPQQRHTGLMFQNYALFPNMTVRENLCISQKSNAAEIDDMLSKFGLERVKDLYPSQISGGQQQRTALARMLLSRPAILMLDEPFSALDSHLRFQMERELLDVFHNFDGTSILVSHNRDEAFRLCERLAIFNNGHIEVEGKKSEVFANPQTRTAAILTGCKNISRAERTGKGKFFATDWGIELQCNKLEDAVKFIGIRMHSITNEIHNENSFECRVAQVIENPFSFTVMLIPKNARENLRPIGWEIERSLWHKVKNETVNVCLPPESLLMLRD